MRTWYNENVSTSTAVMLLSLTHIDVIYLLCSKAFGGSKWFKMPISEVSESSIHYYGIPQVHFFFPHLLFVFFFFFWVVSSINNNNNNIIERSRRCTPDRITAGKMFINLHTVFFSFLPFISLSLSLSLPAKKLFIVVLHFLITPQISMPLDTHTQFKNVSCPIFPIKNSQHKPSAYEIIISFDYCNTLRTQDIQFLIKADIFFPWHIICAYIKNKKRNKKKPIHNMCHGKKCHGKFFFLYR